MGGGLEADLSQGAVPALWGAPLATEGWQWHWRPVLQVVDVRHVPDGTGLRPAPAQYQRYRVLLSDGVYSEYALLGPGLNHLARGDDLRRGSVVRVLRFAPFRDPDHVRTIIIIELEILQTECALIGSLKRYKPTWNSGVSSTIQMGPSCGSYPWKLVGQIKDGYSDKPDFITVKATISCVTAFLSGVTCPLVVNGKQCNADVTGGVAGTWRCNRCGYNFSEPCKYECSVCILIQDHTGMASAIAYELATEEIFGYKAKDLYLMKYKEHDHAQLDDIIMGAVGKQYVFQLKVERQPLPGGVMVKCIVLKAEKVNPSAESRHLVGQIDTLVQEGSGPGSEFHSPPPHALKHAVNLQLQPATQRMC